MKKVLFAVYLLFGIIMSVWSISGIIFGNGVLAKVLYAIALLVVCPLVHYLLIKIVGEEKQNIIRIPCLICGFIFLFIITGKLDPQITDIDEKRLVQTAVDDLKNKYADYDNLNVKSYDKVEEKQDGNKKIIKIKIVFDAIKDAKIDKHEEYYTVSFENGIYEIVP